MKIGYTAREAGELLGLPHSTISYYAQQGIIVPDIRVAGGRGSARIYSKRNLYEILVVRELANSGVKLDAIKKMRDFIKTGRGLSFFKDESNYEVIVAEEEVTVFLEVFNHLDEDPILWIRFSRNLDKKEWRDVKHCFYVYEESENKFIKSYLAINLMPLIKKVKELP